MFVLFYDGKYFHTLLIFDELFLNQLQKTANISLLELELKFNGTKACLAHFSYTSSQYQRCLGGTEIKTPHSITCNVFSSVLTKAFIQVSSMLVANAK